MDPWVFAGLADHAGGNLENATTTKSKSLSGKGEKQQQNTELWVQTPFGHLQLNTPVLPHIITICTCLCTCM